MTYQEKAVDGNLAQEQKMVEPEDRDFNMFREFKKNTIMTDKHMGTLSREIEVIFLGNQMEIRK